MKLQEQVIQEKLQILEEIAVQNGTLLRFVKQRKIVGIRRVLRERGELIDKLLLIDSELKQYKNENHIFALRPILKKIDEKHQEIMESTRQVLREASSERACIAAELRNSRNQRQVRSQYLNPWNEVIIRGRRINTKG